MMLKAIVSGEAIDDAVEHVDRLGLDCARMAAELFVAFMPWLEAMAGKSWSEAVDMYAALDPDRMTDPRDKQLIEVARAMRDADLGDLDRPL